ncbi:MAG: hypothetical protein Q9165_001901 [Trypethelium subeluteriae]
MALPDMPSTSSTTPTETTTSSSKTTTKTSTAAKSLSPEDFTAYISDSRFNRIFQLPADPSRGHAGDHTDEEQVLLFFGPLVSSRLFNTAKEELAKRYKIRIVNAERPGIGKTDSVPAERLLSVWREAIPALLAHLHIPQRLPRLPQRRHPLRPRLRPAQRAPPLFCSRPYVAIAGPWIHSSHSGKLLWSLVAQTGALAAFVNATLAPALGVSAKVSGSVGQLWDWADRDEGREGSRDVEFEEGVRERVVERVFAGGVGGLGQEVQVLLRNGVEREGWSDWGDFDVLAPRLAEAVRDAGGVRLEVDMFFAESDVMIGDAGTKGSMLRDVHGVEFMSETVKGADHDSVWDLRWDVIERMFERMTREA